MFQWNRFLDKHKDDIIEQWQARMRIDIPERYGKRTAAELKMTTTTAYDAFYDVLSRNDHKAIISFIDQITRIRLDGGFSLTDVQKAFVLFREIVLPVLFEECPFDQLYEAVSAVNRCLAFTIHRFSSHFQAMHETHLKDYAKRLEKDVAAQTRKLKDSKEQYQRLVEEILDGYLVLQGEIITFVNQAFCRMHEVTADEILNRSFFDLVAPESHDKVRRSITGQKEKEKEPEAFEYLRQKKDGSCLPTEINFRPSRLKGNAYHLCIVRDITKRVEMEKKSRELERMAYIGNLTASLSHEIRNPLSSVKMNLQIIGKNQTFLGNDKKRLDISKKEIQRLEDILKELLDFAKPFRLKPVKTDINKVVSDCTGLMEVKISKQDINCTVLKDKALPKIMADPAKIEQVIINLLINALESVETSGNIQIETLQRKIEDASFIAIRVQDDGKGITREKQQQVFKPFYTTKAAGSGLGLANVHRIVTAHNGKVITDKNSEGHTFFEVLLPMEAADG